jgi:hypothetical protein
MCGQEISCQVPECSNVISVASTRLLYRTPSQFLCNGTTVGTFRSNHPTFNECPTSDKPDAFILYQVQCQVLQVPVCEHILRSTPTPQRVHREGSNEKMGTFSR